MISMSNSVLSMSIDLLKEERHSEVGIGHTRGIPDVRDKLP